MTVGDIPCAHTHMQIRLMHKRNNGAKKIRRLEHVYSLKVSNITTNTELGNREKGTKGSCYGSRAADCATYGHFKLMDFLVKNELFFKFSVIVLFDWSLESVHQTTSDWDSNHPEG